MGTMTVGAADFDATVLETDGAVLVDFWAPWCGPCRALAPTLEDLSEDYEGQVAIVKVNAEDEPDLARRFGVTGLPTLLLFRAGEERERITGVRSRTQLAVALDGVLGE